MIKICNESSNEPKSRCPKWDNIISNKIIRYCIILITIIYIVSPLSVLFIREPKSKTKETLPKIAEEQENIEQTTSESNQPEDTLISQEKQVEWRETIPEQPVQEQIIEAPPVSSINSSEASFVIWSKLQSYGWSNEVCAGILGNLQCENGTFDPQREGCGYGICQWTNGRYYSLINTYGSYPTLENEVDYLKWEIENGQFMNIGGYSLETFFAAASPEEAALQFATCFERCGPYSYDTRQSFARNWYSMYS